MPTFNAFADILPDPDHPIMNAGNTDVAGYAGPGFSAMNFSSNTDTGVSRTVSGRGVARDGGSQYWSFSISYNPMFREQFDPIDTFLDARNPRKDAFYVILPQYKYSKNQLWNSRIGISGAPKVLNAYTAGTNQLVLYFTGTPAINSGTAPKSGDMFTITDPDDFNHQKVYKIVGVETNDYYQAGTTQPTANQTRIRIAPPLQRNVGIDSFLNFNPMFRVITRKDTKEYSINTDNLYQMSLDLEEFQP